MDPLCSAEPIQSSVTGQLYREHQGDGRRGVGTSKRFAAAYDRRAEERFAEQAMLDFQPVTLREKELELETEPLTKAPKPRPVSAWVRYGDVAVKVDAWAVAWTEFAVAIRWTTPSTDEHKAWVWASAVRSRKV